MSSKKVRSRGIEDAAVEEISKAKEKSRAT